MNFQLPLTITSISANFQQLNLHAFHANSYNITISDGQAVYYYDNE